jgi:hypothetical protein
MFLQTAVVNRHIACANATRERESPTEVPRPQATSWLRRAP